MAHCPFQKLSDLKKILDEIRRWDGIIETRPGVFYLKRKPFLHFHEKDGKRWADAKVGDAWGAQIHIPFGATALQLKKFLSVVRKRYKDSIL